MSVSCLLKLTGLRLYAQKIAFLFYFFFKKKTRPVGETKGRARPMDPKFFSGSPGLSRKVSDNYRRWRREGRS